MKIHLLSTSDTHGWVLPDNFAGNKEAPFGLARAKTAIEQFKQDHLDDLTLVFDDGDFIQGSPMTNFIAQTHQEFADIFEKLALAVGYDARTIGNHEFNHGVDYLLKALPDSDAVVAANILREGKPLYKKPYKIIEKNGIKIGVIGLTTEFVPVWEREEHIPNMEFINPVKTAKQLIPEMKKSGAEIIIALYHSGFEADLDTGVPTERLSGENRGYQLLQEVEGIDALISGHQHRQIERKINTPFKKVPVTQPGQKGSFVGHIELNYEDKKIIDSKAELIETKNFKPAPEIVDIVSSIQNQLDKYLDTVIGEFDKDYLFDDYFKARLYSHPVIELMNTVLAEAVGAEISANSLFNNEVPGFKKEITRRDIVVNYLYPNTSVAESITGKELLEALEQSAHFFEVEDGKVIENPLFTSPKVQYYNYDIFTGIDYVIDASKPHDERIISATSDGQPIDLDKKYVVAVSNFRANGTGGYSMFSMQKSISENTEDMSELLEKFIVKNSPLKLTQPTNLKVIGGELP